MTTTVQEYNTDCLAQQWIVWIVMDCIHNMFSITSVKTMNKTTTRTKILLNMSSTLQCLVKHTGKHQHVEQLLHV